MIKDCPKCGVRLVDRQTKLYVDERIKRMHKHKLSQIKKLKERLDCSNPHSEDAEGNITNNIINEIFFNK